MPNALETAHQYFAAWNSHNAAAIAGLFAEGGTYQDPVSGEISGAGIEAYAAGLWESFSDLSFEIVSASETGAEVVAAQWVMRGTNTGRFMGLPPSGRAVSLPGADFIETADEKITSVRGYFDSGVLPQQLGLQALVQPHELGPFSFGNAVAVHSGKKTLPGAFGVTVIYNTEEQTPEVADLSRKTAVEMLGMQGFLGATLVRIGDQGITLSAWEEPDNIHQLRHGGAHLEAMQRFWSELGYAGYTSVWIQDHINPLWVRCTACNKMMDYEERNGVCTCGHPLPAAPAYF